MNRRRELGDFAAEVLLSTLRSCPFSVCSLPLILSAIYYELDYSPHISSEADLHLVRMTNYSLNPKW
jgi:hypothetical protein